MHLIFLFTQEINSIFNSFLKVLFIILLNLYENLIFSSELVTK